MTAPLQIGWGTRDITPERPVLLRGLFNLRVATHIRDRLTTTALALDNGVDQALIISVDACGVDEGVVDACRQALTARCPEVVSQKVFVSATHTHTAPFAGSGLGLQNEAEYLEALRQRYPDYLTIGEYTRVLMDGIVGAACQAWESRCPAQVGWGASYAVVGENRRIRYFDDRAVMYGKTSEEDFSHVEGHVDHGVNLLFTYTPTGTLTGALVNVACPAQANEGGQDYLSADYWHDVRAALRQRYGFGLSILPQCSAAGDQTPHRLIGARAEDRMLRLKYGEGLSKASNAALRQDIARRLAAAVEDAEPAVRKDLHAAVVLRHEQHMLDLPHWDVTAQEHAAAQAEAAQLCQQLEALGTAEPLGSRATALRSRLGWCQRAIDRYQKPLASVPIRTNILRLGDVAFVTAPFEYYLDFGDRIKGRSPALQTFVVQLAGGGTYLPTERAASGRSYGAVPASCRVAPRGGQIIVDKAVATLRGMFTDP
jgi:hypothetical protein